MNALELRSETKEEVKMGADTSTSVGTTDISFSPYPLQNTSEFSWKYLRTLGYVDAENCPKGWADILVSTLLLIGFVTLRRTLSFSYPFLFPRKTGIIISCLMAIFG